MNEHLKRSRKQEKRGANVYGGTVNAGSGNKARKNDVRSDEWSIEFKTTTNGSYSLRLKDLEDASRNAVLEHRKLLFGIDFAGRDIGTRRFVVLEESDLLEVLDRIGLLEGDLEDAKMDLTYWREKCYDAESELAIWSSNSG